MLSSLERAVSMTTGLLWCFTAANMVCASLNCKPDLLIRFPQPLSRLAFGLAEELRPHGAAALALSPGHMRTERVLQHFGTGGWRGCFAV